MSDPPTLHFEANLTPHDVDVLRDYISDLAARCLLSDDEASVDLIEKVLHSMFRANEPMTEDDCANALMFVKRIAALREGT